MVSRPTPSLDPHKVRREAKASNASGGAVACVGDDIHCGTRPLDGRSRQVGGAERTETRRGGVGEGALAEVE